MALIDLINEQEEPQNAATPSLSEVLQQAISAKTNDTRTSMPGKVISYDHEKQMVSVQPLFKKKYNDGTIESLPVIHNVPVAFQRSGGAFMSMPIEKDHYVMLHFMDRSMDKWKTNGGELHPDDTRTHDISDAVAYPGLYPFNDTAAVPNSTDVVIKNPGEENHHEIRLKKNGHVQFLNGSDELINVLVDFVRCVRDAVTPTCGGPKHLQNDEFAPIEERLRTFLER